MSKLAEFLIRLSQDPAQQIQYKSDPEGTMRRAGLNPDEIALVKNKDVAGLQARVGDDVELVANGQVKAYRK